MTTSFSGVPQQLDPRQVGERIRLARRGAQLSQTELAKRSGLSRVSISQLENGRRSHVNPSVLRRIAAALKEVNLFGAVAEPTDQTERMGGAKAVSGPLLAIFERLSELPDHQQTKLAQILEGMFDWRDMAHVGDQ